ncbi:hypothetical protein pEaSNUABM37_00243 [Erwinia phage pEa_SNUABM_37]|nr:hypothetical protein pEaSNUABM37_00243 [Erwinia phage pEa_SNUABM_37]QXO10711.1 hypothetical protein pEaSNUABM48_00243 [Erwinia phage pEa_SNUABM_48]
MNLYLAMRPTMYRWFNQQQLDDPTNRMAFSDLLQFVAESATGQHSEIDVIGPSSYLMGIGIPREYVDLFVQTCGAEIHSFYMNNSTPEWRDWGRHRVSVDPQYDIFIQLGNDPYV